LVCSFLMHKTAGAVSLKDNNVGMYGKWVLQVAIHDSTRLRVSYSRTATAPMDRFPT
jgi:hypothetical protein